ncbi:hypothetical protein ABGB07_44865 [Micromonosporaceae bacterium B7E4]
MSRSHAIAAGLALAFALAGCGSDAEPTAAAPAVATPAATTASATDWSRMSCTMLSALDTVDFNPASNRAIGDAATKSSNPGIATAGAELEAAANRPDADEPGEGPIAISEAQIELAEACSSLYGDGNW